MYLKEATVGLIAILFGFVVGSLFHKSKLYHACEKVAFVGEVCESVKPSAK